ncbi:GrpB family protein [Anaerotignum sp.]|uniref:GrpB family protein n=1 Tax=Anaerotignum sp. TaxID=2039241 RepID=UPI00271492CB|nr:GrpB family protein [Anaerotignum sp.]
MGKSLSEMSLQELWRLFPIFLTEHQEQWEDWFKEEAAFLHKILANEQGIRIGHVGSTAISAIWAKPIVDILVEVPVSCDMDEVKRILIQKGYICMSESESRISFNKGYTEDGFAEKVYHLHLRYVGDNHELYFRDFLNENPVTAKEYETLKLCLWKRYEHDRDGYTKAKTEFVLAYTQRAKEKYGDRYC